MAYIPFDFSHVPTLETDHLHLRELEADDATVLLQHFQRAETYPSLDTLDAVADWIYHIRRLFEFMKAIHWGIIHTDTNTLIGFASIQEWHQASQYAEVSYSLTSLYTRHRYAVELIQALVAFSFKRLELNRLEASVILGDDDMMLSLEQAGFQHEGVLRERIYANQQYHDLHLYAILLADYNARVHSYHR